MDLSAFHCYGHNTIVDLGRRVNDSSIVLKSFLCVYSQGNLRAREDQSTGILSADPALTPSSSACLSVRHLTLETLAARNVVIGGLERLFLPI
jgi:hypothetical protein